MKPPKKPPLSERCFLTQGVAALAASSAASAAFE